jgi:predicted ABC-type ATPase
LSAAYRGRRSLRRFAPRLKALRTHGYRVRLIFLYLASADLAVERVQTRVAEGGHAVPHEVVRRRYIRGLRNLLKLYIPLADQWIVYDNTNRPSALIARSGRVAQPALWTRIQAEHAQ